MGLWGDWVRGGWRQYRTRPFRSIVMLTILALSFGVALGFFNVVSTLKLGAINGAPGSSQLLNVYVNSSSEVFGMPSGAVALELVKHEESLGNVIPYLPALPVDYRYGSKNNQTTVQFVGEGYFSALEVDVLLGRTLKAEDALASAMPVAVISERLWRSQFNANPTLVGKDVTFNEMPVRVVGIVGEEFPGVGNAQAQIWTPFTNLIPVMMSPAAFGAPADSHPANVELDGISGLMLLLQPKQGMSISQASARLKSQVPNLIKQGLLNNNATLNVSSGAGMKPTMRERLIRYSMLYLAASVLLLFVAALYFSGFLLTRLIERNLEMQVRTALGATPRDLILQILIEAALISIPAGLLAIVIAALLPGALAQIPPFSEMATVLPSGMDWRSGLFIIVGLMVMTGLIISGPAWRLRTYAGSGFQAAKASASKAQAGLLKTLAGLQTGVAFIAVTCTGIFALGLWELNQADLGYEPSNINILPIEWHGDNPPARNVAELLPTVKKLQSRLKLLPEIAQVAVTDALPIRGTPGAVTSQAGNRETRSGMSIVSANYFQVFDIDIKQGQGLNGVNDVVISESLAKKLWPDETAIGNAITLDVPSGDLQLTVSGIVPDIYQGGISLPQAYISLQAAAAFLKNSRKFGKYLTLVVKGNVSTTLLGSLSKSNSKVPKFGYGAVASMQSIVNESRAGERVRSGLAVLSSAVLLAISVLGVYAVVAYQVAVRRLEWGIRLTLGATFAELVYQVLRETLFLLAVGVAVGFIILIGGGLFLPTDILPVPVWHPLPIVAGVVAVIVLGLLAAWLPARELARMEPGDVLYIE